MRKFLCAIALLCSASIAWAQYVPVHAQLSDGTGNLSTTAYLHFELQNCGKNWPTVSSNPLVIVNTAFDLKPNQPDGSILGQVIPNDQILCGLIPSTLWKVTRSEEHTSE